MKKLTPTGVKVLKVLHIICALLWFGSAILMNLLRQFVDATDATGMYYMAETLEAIDMKMLVPGAIGCLLTGAAFGLFSNWGFFKHRWLTVKWIFTIFMILLGTFYMGPLVKGNVAIGKAMLEGFGDANQYWHNVTCNMFSGLLQLSLLTFVVVISVFKPWKKKHKV